MFSSSHLRPSRKLKISNLPVAVPIPIKEEPASFMIARTSAKSTLTRPGTCDISNQPPSGEKLNNSQFPNMVKEGNQIYKIPLAKRLDQYKAI